MNGGNAELLVNELVHVCHGEFGARRLAAYAFARFIAIGTADGVAVMSICNHNRVRRDRRRDCCNAGAICNTLNTMNDSKVISNAADQFAGFGKQLR